MGLVALLVPASVLALGSVPTLALAVVSLLSATACGLLWWEDAPSTSRAARTVLLVLGLLLAMTVLQAVPLPPIVTQTLTPANADIWARSLAPLREPGPAWHTFSLAPTATRVEVLRGFFYLTVFLSSLRVAQLRYGSQFLVRLIVFSSCLLALTTLGHASVSAERVFGLYLPHERWAYRAGRLSPLLNSNHLAAYLNLGACVAVGALVTRTSLPRALSASAAIVLVATSLWQGSRGGTGSLCLGMVLVVGLAFYARRRLAIPKAHLLVAGGALLASAAVAVSLFDLRERFERRDFVKAEIARSALSLVKSSPWVGTGRGSFESVFSSVWHGDTYLTFTHPEDFLVQWVVEWGIPISIVAAVLLGWAMRPAVLLRAAKPAIGAWVALVVAVLHEVVDYHFEVPGVVALALVCAAIVVASRATSPAAVVNGGLSPALLSRWPALVAVVGTGIAVAVAWPSVGHSLAEERRLLGRMAVDKDVTASAFRAAVRPALLGYPAEPFLPLMGAVRVQASGEGSVVPWIARSLSRNPRFGRAHFVLAQSLARDYRAQARLEYRLAYEGDRTLLEAVGRQAVALVDDPRSALDLITDGAKGTDMLEVIVKALATRLPSTAVVLDREIERRSNGALGPAIRRAEAAANDALTGAPWCMQPRDCSIVALDAADDLARLEPTLCAPHVRVARLRIATGGNESARALDDLERATAAVTDRGVCERELIQLAFANRDTARAESALERLVRGGCGTDAECIDLYSWAASVEEGRGHFLRAARFYRRALDLAPDREDLLERIGAMGERDGALPEALNAYMTLASRHPADTRWPTKLAELRARVRPSAATTLPLAPGSPSVP